MNRKIRTCLLPFTWVLLILVIASCSPARKILKQPIKEEGVDYVFGLLKKNEFIFNRFSAKFTAFVDIDNKKNNLTGQIRVSHDSLIWVSLTPALGLEAARILITLDSVFFINRIENSYLKTDFSFINDNLNSGFDFDLLQALILGNDLSFYENDKFRVTIDNMKYRLNTIGRRKLKRYVRNQADKQKVLIQNIWVDPESGKIEKVLTKELGKDNKKLEVEYSDFQAVEGQSFPHRMEVKIDAEKNIDIDIVFSRIKLNEPTSFPFSIPEKYTRLTGK